MKTDSVTVKVTASLPEINLVAQKIGPFSAGSEIELDRWQAEVLGEWGIIEWHKDSQSLLLQAYQSRDKEQRGRGLESIGDIYQMFPGLVRCLREEGMFTQKRNAVKALLEDLVSSRTNKITRLCRLDQEPPMDSLSPEEQWLFSSLNRIFRTWRENTGSLMAESRGDDQ